MGLSKNTIAYIEQGEDRVAIGFLGCHLNTFVLNRPREGNFDYRILQGQTLNVIDKIKMAMGFAKRIKGAYADGIYEKSIDQIYLCRDKKGLYISYPQSFDKKLMADPNGR